MMRLSARMQGSKVLLTGGCFEKSRRTHVQIVGKEPLIEFEATVMASAISLFSDGDAATCKKQYANSGIVNQSSR